MKSKFLIPVLALIFATGMSFTTANATKAALTGYVQTSPGNWQAVNVDCDGFDKCLIRFQGETQIHQVYATMDTSQPLEGSGTVKVINP